jgi:putative Mg2+ transporter-C (MgtC) family protein
MELIAYGWFDQLEIAARVGFAALIGAIVGAEREISNKPAGLRTHALLAAAAALFVGLAAPLIGYVEDENLSSALRPDPIRIAEAIVTGVAFIGAGTIFRHREADIVEGLTTAATLLLVSGLAIAVAVRQAILATAITVMSLVILRVLRRLTR